MQAICRFKEAVDIDFERESTFLRANSVFRACVR